MPLNKSRFNTLPAPSPLNYAAQRLTQLQADLVSTARMWAVDEVGAAMAHQLNEPLTALLLYLHEIKEKSELSEGTEAAPESMREMVDRALRETERVCDIMERMGHAPEAPVDAETAVARGREAIDSWAQNGHANGNGHISSPSPRSGFHTLTPREREVLALITAGASNKEGGYRLGISTRTFEVHRAHIMGKLGAKNAADLVRMALSEPR
jgi:DNA-binding CsgD family transcriptional regulator